MTKTSFLSWINIILLPIIVNYFFRDNFYGATGLAGVIFDYHISAIASGLTLKLIDPLTLIFKILLWFKKTRNYLIKAKYHKITED